MTTATKASTNRDELPAEPPAIGLLAGGGAAPVAIVRSLLAQGRRVHVVGLGGPFHPPADAPGVTCDEVGIAQIGKMLWSFREQECRDLMIAGTVRRPDLWTVRPDLGFFTNIPAILALTRGGDDRLLRRVVRFFEDKGFRVRGLADETPDLLVPKGPLGRVVPTPDQEADATQARLILASLGHLDVGQAVVMRDGRLCAVEGAEGTDGLLKRVAEQHGNDARGSGVLVKMPKPGQDMRMDLPTIGPETINNARAAGLAGIAVASAATLLIEASATREAADAAGVAVWGMDPVPAEPDAGAAGARTCGSHRAITAIGRKTPARHTLRDAAGGTAALAALQAFSNATGAIVSREHVLALGVDEPPADLIARAARLKQWGDTARSRRRQGTAVLANLDALDETVIRAAAQASLSAIHIVDGVDRLDASKRETLAQLADENRIALTGEV